MNNLPKAPHYIQGLLKDGSQMVLDGKLDRAAQRFRQKYSPGSSKILVIGDSYAVGGGASVPATTSFSGRLSAEFGSKLQYANMSGGGTVISEYVLNPRIYGTAGGTTASKTVIEKGDITVGILGLNDLKGAAVGADGSGCGPNPNNFGTLKSRVMAMALHFLIPETSKVRALNIGQTALNSAQVSTTGTWVVGLGANTDVIFSNTANSSITFNGLFGNLLVLNLNTINATANGSLDLEIDGVSYGQISRIAKYDDGWAADCILIPVTNGSHSVKLTVPAGGGACVTRGISCVDTTDPDFSATFVYATPWQLNDGAGVGWGTGSNKLNSAAENSVTGAAAFLYGNGGALRFGQAIDEAMDTLYTYGFNTVKADITPFQDLNTMMDVDTLHPNDRGYRHIFDRLRPVVQAILG